MPSIDRCSVEGEMRLRSNQMNCKEVYTIMASLRICAKTKDLDRGSELHAHILKRGLLKKNPCLASPLINMYSKCGVLEKAQEVLEGLHVGDLVSWNVLISGYVSKRQTHEAFKCFERMQSDGLSPDAVTFTCILKLCGNIKYVDKGREIHERIVSSGLLQKDIMLGTALVDMYARSGMLEKAQEVLEQLPHKDTVSWNALIGGYAQQGRGSEALNCFDHMQSEGLSPNVVTFICILKACGITGSLDRGKKIHDEIVHRKLLKKDNVLGNALVDMYAKCGMFTKAQHVLEELPIRDVVAWNSLIAGCSHHDQGHEALKWFEGMQNEGLPPNAVTFTCVLKACGSIGSIEKGKQIHDDIVNRNLLQKDIVLGCALVDMYVKCGQLAKAQQVLEELPVRNVVAWSTLIAGYAQQGKGKEALDSFARMQREGFIPNIVTLICVLNACGSTRDIERGKQIHDEVVSRGLLAKDVVLGNTLVDMYAKCDLLAKAQQVLIELRVRNVASWNTLIAGYIQKQQFHQAVDCYEQMQTDGVCADEVTFISILKACGNIGAVDKGEKVHREIVRRRLLDKDIILGNALVDMYAKCGVLVRAQNVLEDLPIHNVVSWNVLISGYAQQGQCYQALNCLEGMCNEGVSPDEVTFLCILSALSQLGLLEKAQTLFLNMKGIYGVTPNLEHHTCMVVGFGCAGQFDEAIAVIQAMPSLDCAIWLALLGACRKRGNLKLGMLAFDQILQLDNSCGAVYILMANIFAVAGMQADAEKVELMRQKYATLRKQDNSPWLQVEKLIDFQSIAQKYFAKLKVIKRGNGSSVPYPGLLSESTAWFAACRCDYVVRWCCSKDNLIKTFASIHYRQLNINNGGLRQEYDFTLVAMLKTCVKRKDLTKGTTLHAHILKKGLLRKSPYLASTLINMYAKCGVLEKAQQVLDGLPFRDVVSWNALIAGYAQKGQGHEALRCFERMQSDGFSPNAVTFTCILKACGCTRAINKGREIHEEVVSKGFLEKDIVLGTALVDMYAKCGELEKAQQVLEELPVRNVVSWSALIAGYAQRGQGHAALDCFDRMQREGLIPNAITFICILKACGGTGSIRIGERIHDAIVCQCLLCDDIALGNALVDMYAKCGMLTKAQQVLEELPHRNVISWNALITGYMEQGHGHETLNCFERMQSEGVSPNGLTYIHVLKACSRTRAIEKGRTIHEKIVRLGLLEKDVVLGTALVDMYAKCGMLEKAQEVLEKLPSRDAISWNALITGYAELGEHSKALQCFDRMQSEGLTPDEVTYVCVLNACGSTGAVDKGKQIHENISRNGLLPKCIMLGNALVDMYAKCGMLGKAQEVLARLPERNIVSWSALIAGYAQQEQGQEALECFEKMQREGVSPNTVTFICILKACGSAGAIGKGKEIHENAINQGLLDDIGVGNALIDMYTKCDYLSKAHEVLEVIPFRNVVSWNTLITGYAQHGEFHKALSCFKQMECEGLLPNRVTYLCLLNACSHLGMLDDAQELVRNMIEKSGITPNVEHHTCMVVAFGNAGCFDDAIAVIKVVPASDYTIWLALLGSCRKWGNVKLGKSVFDQIIQLESSSAAAYILMKNIFSTAGMQQDAENIETMRLKYAPAMPHTCKRNIMISNLNCLYTFDDECDAAEFSM